MNMKQLGMTVLILAGLAALPAAAADYPMGKGSVQLGYHLYKDAPTGFVLNPSAGYFVADGLLVGPVLQFNDPATLARGLEDYFGYGVKAMYYFGGKGRMVRPYVGISYVASSALRRYYRSGDPNMSEPTIDRYDEFSQQQVAPRLGFSYLISRNVSMAMEAVHFSTEYTLGTESGSRGTTELAFELSVYLF